MQAPYRLQYTYDAAGNRTSKVDLLKKDTMATYSYDNVYELVQTALNGKTSETYSYDMVGNRLSSESVPAYSYDNSNELVGFTDNTGGGHSYQYDDNGNPTSKIDPTGTTTYSWDFDNRLVQVIEPGTQKNPSTTVTFRYDPFGRRIQKVSPNGTSNFIYDGANILEELDTTGTVVARYTQGSGIDEPLAAIRGKDTRFYQADGLGSITSLASPSGAISDYYVYDSYGNVTHSHGNFTQPFGFTGRELDAETGLMYYRERYYDPSTGRFAGEDSLRFDGGNDFYLYVHDNPINLKDAFGLCETKDQFSKCMEANASKFSLVGSVDAILGTSFSKTFVGGVLGGNSVTGLLYGSLDENAQTVAGALPDVLTRSMGTVTTYGRRTSTIMSLNWAGKGGLPNALQDSSVALKDVLGSASKILGLGLSLEERIALDAVLAAAEAAYCKTITN